MSPHTSTPSRTTGQPKPSRMSTTVVFPALMLPSMTKMRGAERGRRGPSARAAAVIRAPPAPGPTGLGASPCGPQRCSPSPPPDARSGAARCPTTAPNQTSRLVRSLSSSPGRGARGRSSKNFQHDDEKPLRNQLSTPGNKNWWSRRTASPVHDPTQRSRCRLRDQTTATRPERQEPSINQHRVALVSTVRTDALAGEEHIS